MNSFKTAIEESRDMRVLQPRVTLSMKCLRTTSKMSAMALLLGLVLLMYARHVDYVSWQEISAQNDIVMLQAKLRFQQLQSQMKEDIIRRLKSEIKGNNTESSEENDEMNSVNEEIIALLGKRNGNFRYVIPVQKPEPIRMPLSITTMPHLMRSRRAVCPAFQVLSRRSGNDIDVVIGIPTVKRDLENYLADTITSLIDGMTHEELKKTLIIVSIGEADDIKYIAETAYELNAVFGAYYGELIEVISPSKYWYPDWDVLQPSLGDSRKRTRWRTKQNLDAIFLISYAQSRGAHYLMLEDDVVAKKGFMTTMLRFAANQTISNPHWFFINFSTTGGYGKFFRMEDLGFFSAYLQVLYLNMPIDWLIEQYLAGRVCGLDKSSEKCALLKESIRPTYKISLFEHAGMYSSLRGKIQKVKMSFRTGKNNRLFIPHKNPPLESVTTTIEEVRGHTIEGAYAGDHFFWAKKPAANDIIEFRFNKPIKLDKFFFRTGNAKRDEDVLELSVVEVLQLGAEQYVYVSEFDEFGNSEGYIEATLWPIQAIRIRILQALQHWIIISEIELHQAEPT